MHFTSFLESGRLTVALTGEIDHHYAKAYIQAIAGKIEAYTPQICVLDFREVSFVDSSGIAVVINALRNMAQIEGQLLLQLSRIFKEMGLIEQANKRAEEGLEKIEEVLKINAEAALEHALLEDAFNTKWELLIVQDKIKEAIAAKDWAAITALCRDALDIIKSVR